MNGKQHFQVLSKTHHRDHLLEYAKKNGVQWEESPHEGVNWMRASRAIVHHLDQGKEFDTENLDDRETVKNMLDLYTKLREQHKKTMIPHIRSAMQKLRSEKDDTGVEPMSLINEAHEHLRQNGGHVWAEKVNSLVHMNSQIKKLTSKLDKIDAQSKSN